MPIINSKIVFPNYLLEDKFIIFQKHPTKDLYIYNYTNKTQYEKKWNKYTKIARGLVLDINGNIVSKPFSKFFNWGELSVSKQRNLLKKNFYIFEKMDGYFIQAFLYKNEPIVTSRGSFNSIYSNKAISLFTQKHSNFFNEMEPNKTYIFELIWPEKRIIVDYDNLEDLILLAITNSYTGKDIKIKHDMGFLRPKEYDYKTIDKIRKENKSNAEGYVLYFPHNNFRVKIKFEEYVNMSRALAHLNKKVIWTMLSSGQSLDKLLEKIPDELYDWVKSIETDLKEKYHKIETECFHYIENNISKEMTMKQIAEKIKSHEYWSIIFAILKNKDYSSIIWKRIKPIVKNNDVGIGDRIEK